jgi:transposase-like protein
MEIKDALSLARRSVEEAGLPESWRERAFGEVLRSLLDNEQTATVEQPSRQHDEKMGSQSESALGRLAARLGVSENALADVFAIEDDIVTLHVASVKLPTIKSKATREIALLMVAARQGTGIDESWTDVSHIRDALSQYNRYDLSNFARHLRETDDVFNLRGKPVQQLRLTRPGWEAATELARALAGTTE